MVRLENVSKVYRKKGQLVYALDRVYFHVPAGGFAAVIGPSGSGKTTLMNIIGCLDEPSQGSYYFCGEAMGAKGARAAAARNQRIGFIFQGFNLIASISALENVELPLILRGVPAKARREMAKEALNHVGLSDRAGHRPAELSGGQQQRVAIARVLAGDSDLILADEPTGNLDRQTGREVIATLCALQHLGKTVIIITHDLSVAAAAPRILRMDNGRLEEG